MKFPGSLNNKPDPNSSQNVQVLLQNVAHLAPASEAVQSAVSRPITAQPHGAHGATPFQAAFPSQGIASRPVTAADHTSYYLQVALCTTPCCYCLSMGLAESMVLLSVCAKSV